MDDLFDEDDDDEGGLSIDDFRLIGYLGCGSFGKIVLAKDEQVIMKLITIVIKYFCRIEKWHSKY